jgi:hypothetical protein
MINTAVIEMHVGSGYPLYLAEAHSRWYNYPAPYNVGGTWYYATPWLWIDGNADGSYTYSNWGNLISQRAIIASPITARMWGDYNPVSRSGTINARFISDSASAFPLQGKVLFCITEDSIYYAAPNGDLWHNHVARDYIPDYIGTPVSLAYQDSVTVSYPFTIGSDWVDTRCEIVAMIQNPIVNGLNKDIWQGAKIKLYNLTMDIAEEHSDLTKTSYVVNVMPNPCINEARFAFTLPVATHYNISFFDVSGRRVKTLNGIASGIKESVSCNLKDAISSGIYFYQFESNVTNTSGKIIVK